MLFKDGGNRFDEYAYRIATRQVADAADYLEEGSWISLDSNGKVVAADGTKKSFLCLTSNRTGRDNLTPQAVWPKVSYLHGTFELTVENSAKGDTAFDSTATYAYLTPLKLKKDTTTEQGILTPWTAPTWTANTTTGAVTMAGDAYDKIVAYSLGAAEDGRLRICSR